jgi:hypothetical protein
MTGGEIMKTRICSIFAILPLCLGIFAVTSAKAATCPTLGCDANWLNVPGDFSQPVNYFSMFLIGGEFHIDSPLPNGGAAGVGGAVLSTVGNQINFTASQFDHIGPGQGTSILNASFNHYEIGSSPDFFGAPVSIYLDGQATGTLVDNSDSTQGQWTLNTHVYADWNGNNGMDLGVMPLSTSATYSYATCTNGDCFSGQMVTTTGTSMDYHTGLAYMVGQSTLANGPFQGIRVTIGLQGQDPVVAPVPLPAAAWLLGSGLLGLIGLARRKAA